MGLMFLELSSADGSRHPCTSRMRRVRQRARGRPIVIAIVASTPAIRLVTKKLHIQAMLCPVPVGCPLHCSSWLSAIADHIAGRSVTCNL